MFNILISLISSSSIILVQLKSSFARKRNSNNRPTWNEQSDKAFEHQWRIANLISLSFNDPVGRARVWLSSSKFAPIWVLLSTKKRVGPGGQGEEKLKHNEDPNWIYTDLFTLAPSVWGGTSYSLELIGL